MAGTHVHCRLRVDVTTTTGVTSTSSVPKSMNLHAALSEKSYNQGEARWRMDDGE
jgi:hypothetical protein